MSTTTEPAEAPRFVPALCCTCGNVRQAGWRNASILPERLLKCAACGYRTTHAIVAPEGWDWREKDNRENRDLGDATRLTAHLEAFGVDVALVDPVELSGGMAECMRYLDGAPEWAVRVSDQLSIGERARMLKWAWKAMLPTNDKSWSGPVLEDARGDRFRGCYYRPGDRV